MMEYTFTAKGHENILAEHYKTIEINKDDYLTERGDCIIGIESDFRREKLKEFKGWVDIIFKSGEFEDKVKCKVNQNFNSKNEFVLRKSYFDSPRTFGFNLSKASNKISRELINNLRKGKILEITVIQRTPRKHKNKYRS